jgi:hypothetical protein
MKWEDETWRCNVELKFWEFSYVAQVTTEVSVADNEGFLKGSKWATVAWLCYLPFPAPWVASDFHWWSEGGVFQVLFSFWLQGALFCNAPCPWATQSGATGVLYIISLDFLVLYGYYVHMRGLFCCSPEYGPFDIQQQCQLHILGVANNQVAYTHSLGVDMGFSSDEEVHYCHFGIFGYMTRHFFTCFTSPANRRTSKIKLLRAISS